MIRILLICLAAALSTACEHSEYDIEEYTGDYRYYAGIAEFFDCKTSVKYYVADAGIDTELKDLYSKLEIKDKDDIYIRVKGYLKEERKMEGIDPATVFVAVKFLGHDVSRGCERAIRQGY